MLPNILSNDEHCSNLASTAVHAVLNILSLVLLLFSTSFKLYRILKRHSTKALNFWYLFLGALFNVSQVSIAITGSIVELGTVDCHRYIVHFGLGTLNPLLLLLIHGIILIGSLALYSPASSYASSKIPAERDAFVAGSRHPAPKQARSNTPRNPALFNVVLSLYIIVSLFPNLLALLLDKSSANVGLCIYLKPTLYFHLLILPFLTIGQFVPQLRMLRRERRRLGQLRLDTLASAIDAVLFLLIGISWRQLLAETTPLVVMFWYGLAHPLSWQQWGAWIWFDYVLFGVGQGLVLSMYLFLKHRHVRKSNAQKEDLAEQDEDEASEIAPLLH